MKRQIMMRATLLAVLVSLAGPLSAQDLVGEWQFARPARNGVHAGTITVDQSGQVRLRARGPVQSYTQCGHVKVTGDRVEIVFTSVWSVQAYSLDHFYCTRPGDGILSCFNIDGIGKEDDLFRIERVSGTPAVPDRQMDADCPARQRPQA
jgi:hypothetical protein